MDFTLEIGYIEIGIIYLSLYTMGLSASTLLIV